MGTVFMLASVVIVNESVTWVDIATFCVGALTLVVLVIGGGYTIVQLKTANKQLKLVETSTALETLNYLSGRWDAHLLIRARRLVNANPESVLELAVRTDAENSYEYYVLMALFGFFEELGYLCEVQDSSNTVTQYVKEIYKGPVKYYYPLFEKYINKEKEEGSADEDFGKYFKKLARLVGGNEDRA